MIALFAFGDVPQAGRWGILRALMIHLSRTSEALFLIAFVLMVAPQRALAAPAPPPLASRATMRATTRSASRPTSRPVTLPVSRPISRPMALPASRPSGFSRLDLRIADDDGWRSGLAVGLIGNSPFVLASAALPMIAGIQAMKEGSALGYVAGDELTTVAGLAGAMAIAEFSGGIYLLLSSRRPRPKGGLLRERWNASFYAGFGVAQGIHGLLYIAIGIPLLVMSDRHLEDYLLAVKPYRVIGVTSVIAGSALAILGGVFGIVGWFQGPKILQRVAIAPLVTEDLAGLSLGGRF